MLSDLDRMLVEERTMMYDILSKNSVKIPVNTQYSPDCHNVESEQSEYNNPTLENQQVQNPTHNIPPSTTEKPSESVVESIHESESESESTVESTVESTHSESTNTNVESTIDEPIGTGTETTQQNQEDLNNNTEQDDDVPLFL